MATFEEIHDSPISTSWIESLALEEIKMEESGVVHLNEHLTPAAFLEESSIRFLDRIRDRVELYATKFNDYRGQNSVIKIFKISNTVNDFMLFRSGLRIIFARKSNDLITIAFIGNNKEMFSPRLNMNSGESAGNAHEIRAHVGPFNNITWRFSGEVVNVDALVRHYLTEFIRLSSR